MEEAEHITCWFWIAPGTECKSGCCCAYHVKQSERNDIGDLQMSYFSVAVAPQVRAMYPSQTLLLGNFFILTTLSETN